MVYARFTGTVQDQAGNVVPNANIEVRRDVTGFPLVSIYSDRNGSTGLGNPFTADAQGTFFFHAPGGAYRIRAYTGNSLAPTFERVWRYVSNGTSAETDIEQLGQILQAGIVTVQTEDDLTAITPSEDQNLGGLVLNDPDGTKNGYWTWDAIEEEWVFARALPDTVAEFINIGGTADAVTADLNAGVDPANILLYVISPDEPNTGDVTLNGDPVLNVNGEQFAPGEFDGTLILRFDGSEYQAINDAASASSAASSAAAANQDRLDAEDAADRAEAAAAGVEYPVSYAPQSLDVGEQAQARANISALASDGSDWTGDDDDAAAFAAELGLPRPVLFAEIVVGSATDAIRTIDNIPPGYTNMLVKVSVRSTEASPGFLRFRVNEIATENWYNLCLTTQDNTTVSGVVAQATQAPTIPPAASGSPADNFATLELAIDGYAAAAKRPRIHVKGQSPVGPYNRSGFIDLGAVVAIERLDFWLGGTSQITGRNIWAVGSTIEVWLA